MAVFSVVATPIGNLDDITHRAVEVLRQADIILCEDTRTTKKLLLKYGIDTQTISYHAHSGISKTDGILSALREGKNIALVSDAGTPGISDPGAELVGKIRKELADEILSGEIKIQAVPGPSAFVAALSVSGVPCSDFVFLGFLPHKKGRQTLFKEMAESKRTVVFYESPHRILKTLESLREMPKPKRVTVCRELTKIFEETISGTPDDVARYFSANPDKVRGEFVVILSE